MLIRGPGISPGARSIRAPSAQGGLAEPGKASVSKTVVGVRVAQGEAVWTKFQPDRLYTLTLESDGGLNITSAPLKGMGWRLRRAGVGVWIFW